MFSGRKNNYEAVQSNSNTNTIDTLISASTNLTGDINATGTVRIDGNYRGNIKTETEIVVGTTGKITGNLEAQNITIAGNVEGNIKCTGMLEILSSGIINGDIEINELSINVGGCFNGKCSMNKNNYNELEVGLSQESDQE